MSHPNLRGILVPERDVDWYADDRHEVRSVEARAEDARRFDRSLDGRWWRRRRRCHGRRCCWSSLKLDLLGRDTGRCRGGSWRGRAVGRTSSNDELPFLGDRDGTGFGKESLSCLFDLLAFDLGEKFVFGENGVDVDLDTVLRKDERMDQR